MQSCSCFIDKHALLHIYSIQWSSFRSTQLIKQLLNENTYWNIYYTTKIHNNLAEANQKQNIIVYIPTDPYHLQK